MNIRRSLFYAVIVAELVADVSYTYHIIPCVDNRKMLKLGDINTSKLMRKLRTSRISKIVKNKCRNIRNATYYATEYVLELFIIIDIMLPKNDLSIFLSKKKSIS